MAYLSITVVELWRNVLSVMEIVKTISFCKFVVANFLLKVALFGFKTI